MIAHHTEQGAGTTVINVKLSLAYHFLQALDCSWGPAYSQHCQASNVSKLSGGQLLPRNTNYCWKSFFSQLIYDLLIQPEITAWNCDKMMNLATSRSSHYVGDHPWTSIVCIIYGKMDSFVFSRLYEKFAALVLQAMNKPHETDF